MPRFHNLLAPLAIAALLTAGTAHAEARRSAQSMSSAPRFTAPAPAPSKATRQEPGRVEFQQSRVSERDDSGKRGRGDPNRYENRRYDHDRDDYERAKEREGRKFEHHHDRDDSPGC